MKKGREKESRNKKAILIKSMGFGSAKSEKRGSDNEIKRFAFLIHPRISLKEDMGKVSPLFRCFPDLVLQKAGLFLPPIFRGRITSLEKDKTIGWIVVIPLSGKQILSLPKELVLKKIMKALEMAKERGIEIIGLGELISPVTSGGEDLIGKIEGIYFTNGNSLAAASIFIALKKISQLKGLDLSKNKIAIVGAGGSVGRGIFLLLKEENYPLILIDKKGKLKELKNTFSFDENITLTNEISLIKEAKIIVVVTSSTEQIIKSDYLGKEAIIYDITQPRNTSPEILKKRKDVTIIDGGIFDTSKFDYGMDIGLKSHQAYACLVETIIFALEGIEENYVGYVSLEKAKKMLKLMEKYQDYFKLNIFQSFGKPLNEKLELISQIP